MLATLAINANISTVNNIAFDPQDPICYKDIYTSPSTALPISSIKA